MPYAASRSAPGTAYIESSATEATSGMVRMPTPMPAAMIVKVAVTLNRFCTIVGLITWSAK